jgi:hypothetical protein
MTFIPAAGASPWQVKSLPVLAHAAVYADGQASWVPAQNQFVELQLSPLVLSSAAGEIDPSAPGDRRQPDRKNSG